jgi:hypothetical protein
MEDSQDNWEDALDATDENSSSSLTVHVKEPSDIKEPMQAHPLASNSDILFINTAKGRIEVKVGCFFRSPYLLPGATLKYENKNLFYSYENIPIVGWRKLVYMYSPSFDTNNLNVIYEEMESGYQVTTLEELEIYFDTSGIPKCMLVYFTDFKKVYCVCHRDQRSILNTTYKESCQFGIGGCGGWFHQRCVGIYRASRREYKGAVCPLCVILLNCRGESWKLKDLR